jgi:hypothetical protein
VSIDELLQTLQIHISEPAPPRPAPKSRTSRKVAPPPAESSVEELILKAVANAPVVSLADLRRVMPHEYRGRAFDEAVLRLADQRQVVVSQDADPSAFSQAERAEYVTDGGNVFTTISKWS